MEKAKRIFAKNAEKGEDGNYIRNEVHVTTDGQHFFEKKYADAHAAHLGTDVTTITRAEAEAWTGEESIEAEIKTPSEKPLTKAQQAAADKKAAADKAAADKEAADKAAADKALADKEAAGKAAAAENK